MKKVIFVLLICFICFFCVVDKVNALENEYEVVKITNKGPDKDDIISGFNKSGLGGFGDENQSCSELLGPSLVKFIKAARIAFQGLSAGLAIAYGMMAFIPAITSKDSDALKKALDRFVKVLVVLALILLFPTLIKFIGNLCGFDLSCV